MKPARSVLLGCLSAATLLAALPAEPAPGGAGPDVRVERGRYLVEHVAMCGECHTPRTHRGESIPSERLRGAPIPVRSPFPHVTWATEAPNIAGMTGYTEESGVRLLTEGIGRDGRPPRPPMPRFRMNREDAEAVVSYLRSLP